MKSLNLSQVFDANKDRVISREELQNFMIRHGKILSIDQITAGVSTSDKNDDGVIDRAEFVQIVTKKIIFNNLLENELA